MREITELILDKVNFKEHSISKKWELSDEPFYLNISYNNLCELLDEIISQSYQLGKDGIR